MYVGDVALQPTRPVLRAATRGRFLEVVACLLVLVLLASACGGADDRASASGARTVAAAASAGTTGAEDAVASATVAPNSQTVATAVPTSESDAGVVVVIPPTATPDTAPINAAPAIPGTPIVIGLRPDAFQGPDVIRSGVQTWAIVNVSGAEASVAIVNGSVAVSEVTVDTESVWRSDVIGVQRSVNVEIDLAAGSWLRVIFDASGAPVVVAPFSVAD